MSDTWIMKCLNRDNPLCIRSAAGLILLNKPVKP